MTRHRIGQTALALMMVLGMVWVQAAAEPSSRGNSPWKHVIYGNDGRLVAASGQETPTIPLVLTSESSVHNGQLITAVRYQRGDRTLSIERTYDGSNGVDTIYETDDERVFLSVLKDDLTGESLVVYRMPAGEVFSLWLTDDGEILSGDIEGLRRSLQQPREITRLLKAYVRHKKPLDGDLPATGEVMLMPLVTCEDRCAVDCDMQCAFECVFGLPFCKICKVSCGLGCLIGCSG